MRKVIKVDANGLFAEDVILPDNEPTPEGCIDIECPAGFYKPKWTGTAWVEGLTQDQIDAIQNAPTEPTEIELLQAEVARLQAVVDTMLTGGAS